MIFMENQACGKYLSQAYALGRGPRPNPPLCQQMFYSRWETHQSTLK